MISLSALTALAQQPVLKPAGIKRDTIISTIKTDTLTKKPGSSSGLTAKVTYNAEDSIRYSRDGNIVYLYGKSRIIYEDFELDADYIRLDQKNNTVFASGYKDVKNNRYRGKPILKQGSEAPVSTDSLLFNYKTKKGKSYGVFTDVDGGYLHAGQFKKNEFNEGFFKNGIYTTCDAPHPHFGIHITRGIVTEKQIITGPAYLEIEDVPLPVAIPFGFFPKTNKRSSGLLFPTFGEEPLQGFFMRDLGYYVGLSDYWDLALYGTIYSKGSYLGRADTRYKKNYKYDGSINLSYASTRNGLEGTPDYEPRKDFNIRWYHTQSQQANPGTNFSASVDAGTSQYNQNTRAGGTYNVRELTRNTAASTINYSKDLGLLNFSSSLSHRQDFADSTISLNLPEFTLSMPTLSPFDRKDRIGDQKWYQKITFGYTLNGRNSIDTKDYLLFKKESLQKFRNGVQHNIPLGLSLNVFKFFQFTTSVPYNEKWYLQTIRKRLSTTTNKIVIDTIQGFDRVYDYSFTTSLSTDVYGQLNFKKGKLMAIRHKANPSIGLSYQPDFGSDRYGFYRDVTDANGNIQKYSIYENTVYGGSPFGRRASMNFSLNNTIEAKVRSTKDSVNNFVKIPILRSLTLSGNYNFAADSFKLSTIGFSGNTAIFKEKLSVNFNGTLDPYQINQLGNRINQYAINNGKIARLTSFNLLFDYSFNSSEQKSRRDNLNKQDPNLQNMTEQQKEELDLINRNPNAFVDFNVPWNITVGYNFNYSKPGLKSEITINSLNFSGDVNVSPKWKIGYSSGYDLREKKITTTQFTIYRDLHCWDLSFSWGPFGQYQFYSVDLRVKASTLQQLLKLSKRRDYSNYY